MPLILRNSKISHIKTKDSLTESGSFVNNSCLAPIGFFFSKTLENLESSILWLFDKVFWLIQCLYFVHHLKKKDRKFTGRIEMHIILSFALFTCNLKKVVHKAIKCKYTFWKVCLIFWTGILPLNLTSLSIRWLGLWSWSITMTQSTLPIASHTHILTFK